MQLKNSRREKGGRKNMKFIIGVLILEGLFFIFKIDSKIGKIIYVILQCTWGLGQTLIGFIFFLYHRKCEHNIFNGCIDTKWNSEGGLSLGLFIFSPKDDVNNAQLIRVHEYGHTIQSLLLGPFYAMIGSISIVWGNLPYYARMRREKKLPYTACWVEAWASKLGEVVLREPAIWQ